MRVATFNCNSVRVRLPVILDWLDSHSPDFLALQETKAADRDFPEREIRERGWHVAYRGERSYNGVAVISRERLDGVSFGFGDDDGASDSRLVRATAGGFTLVNTYVPQGREIGSEWFSFKLAWLDRLAAYFRDAFDPARDRALWAGDLNVAPEPMDVYDSKAVWPHVCHCREVVDAFRRVAALGFVDVFRKHLPDPGVYTFWDYRQKGTLERNRGWRIDHLLATRPLADRSRCCQVDVEPRRGPRPSDHTFVYADFID